MDHGDPPQISFSWQQGGYMYHGFQYSSTYCVKYTLLLVHQLPPLLVGGVSYTFERRSNLRNSRGAWVWVVTLSTGPLYYHLHEYTPKNWSLMEPTWRTLHNPQAGAHTTCWLVGRYLVGYSCVKMFGFQDVNLFASSMGGDSKSRIVRCWYHHTRNVRTRNWIYGDLSKVCLPMFASVTYDVSDGTS
jgi:hypothetical protein